MRRLALTGCFLSMLLPVTASAADRQKSLVGSDMLGTYTCSACKDVTGHADAGCGKIGWTYAGGAVLMFFARLAPTKPVTFIDETWTLESPDTGYIAGPNPNSKDMAMYRSGTVRCNRMPTPSRG